MATLVERKTAVLALLLVAALVAAYLPALAAGFVWNDDSYLTENPNLDDADGLRRTWTEPRANEQYYPLVFTSFWVEKRLWGLRPFGYHLVNVLLHAAAALLLGGLLRRLGLPAAGLAAAAFALHPVCVESVAWVTERKNVLSLVLALASAHAWLSFRAAAAAREAADGARKRRKGRGEATRSASPAALWTASLAAFALALLAKTTVAVLPAALLVVVWWKEGRLRLRDVGPLLPFFVLGASLGLHTAWLERDLVRATGAEWAHGLADRVVLAGQTTAFYASKIAWPADLAFLYRRWTVDAAVPVQWLPAAGWAAALAGGWAAARRGRRGPLAALLLFGGVLFPAMGFFNVYPMRYSWVADHFAYLGVAVAAAAAVCGGAVLLATAPERVRRGSAVAAVVLLALLGTLSHRQARAYHDPETLWRTTLERNPECFLCLTNLGHLLLESGRIAEAVPLFERSLAIKPDAVPTLLNLARIAEGAGRPAEAADRLRAALRTDPANDEARVHLATILAKAGRLGEAIPEYRQALATPSPEDFLAQNGLGVALVQAGRVEEGIGHLRECVRLRPDYVPCRANLDAVLAASGAR